MKPFYRFIRILFKLVFILFYHHRTYGTSHIPHGRAIIAPNHVSFFDPPLIGVSCPEEVHYLAKDVLFESAWLGPIIRNLNAFPVSGNVGDLKTIKSLVHLLQSNEKVIIFPEGIRTFDGKLAPIKPGIALIALRAQAPIIPTYIHGTFEIWPRQNKYPKPWGKTICAFGTPIYPESYQHLDKKEAQQAVAKEIQTSLERLAEWYHSGAKGETP
jgi:1-acyl-sn-glycerol-3-phosphate acyltransferase